MLHEVLCSFAYGVNLANQRVSTRAAFLSILFLSFSIPLGMVLMAMVRQDYYITKRLHRPVGRCVSEPVHTWARGWVDPPDLLPKRVKFLKRDTVECEGRGKNCITGWREAPHFLFHFSKLLLYNNKRLFFVEKRKIFGFSDLPP
jgi:hypothetical protein